MLLEFLNLGGAEIVIIMIIMLLLPTVFIVYSIVDILRSDFKNSINKLLFLVLVIFAPFIGSIIYMAVRNQYKILKNSQDYPFG